jgi:hypothetical protein
MYRQLPLVHEPQHASLVLLAPILVFEQLLSVPIFWAEGRVREDRGPRAQLQHAASILGLVCWAAARLMSHLPRAKSSGSVLVAARTVAGLQGGVLQASEYRRGSRLRCQS